MNRGWPAAAAVVVAVAALAVTDAQWRASTPTQASPVAHDVAVRARMLVCPNVNGRANVLTTTMTVADVGRGSGPRPKVAYRPLDGSPHPARQVVAPRPTASLTVTAPYGAVAVDAAGNGAGRVVAGQVAIVPAGIERAFTDAACTPPATDWWFAGADGRVGATDTLFLANPADAAANVSLSLWSTNGPLTPPGASGIVVPAHGLWQRNIADLAPDAQGVAVHVHAQSGTVAAALYDRRYRGITPAGGDWIPPTLPPARTQVVAGYAPYTGPKGIALANPGDHDASVALRVVTAHGNFTPSGAQSLVVPAGRSIGLDLQGAIGSDPASVAVTSDAPVVAEGVSIATVAGGFDELAWQPAQQPLSGPSGVAMTVPPFGQQTLLVLSAPTAAARLRVAAAGGADAVVDVPAGRSTTVDLRTALRAGTSGPGPIVLTPVSGGPVYAVRILYALGSHGPLLASEPPTPFPADVRIPGVVSDLRVGAQSSSP